MKKQKQIDTTRRIARVTTILRTNLGTIIQNDGMKIIENYYLHMNIAAKFNILY